MNQNCFEYCVYKIVLHYMYIILFVHVCKTFLTLVYTTFKDNKYL